MEGKGSNIKSSQSRGTPVAHTTVDNFQPQNGDANKIKRDPAGKDTRHVEKSTSREQAGPKTNNL